MLEKNEGHFVLQAFFPFFDNSWNLGETIFRPFLFPKSGVRTMFLSKDVYPGELEEPASLYRYAYTGNNPVNYNDPLGLQMCRGFPNIDDLLPPTEGGAPEDGGQYTWTVQ